MSGDKWRTPPEVFNTLNKEFEFYSDMAACSNNSVCDEFYDEEDDSLSFNWNDQLDNDMGYGNKYVWCNCPYSNPMPWVKKAIEAQSDGLGVVMLLNADCSVGWFAEAAKYVSEIRFIIGDEKEGKPGKYASGRLGFLNEKGEPVNGNNKPQFILVFNPFKVGECVTSYIKKSELYI